MERRKFIKNCCYTAVAIPAFGILLQSCETIYYATSSTKEDKTIVAKTEFIQKKKNKVVNRKFVLVKLDEMNYPICLYKTDEEIYTASLLQCTHQGCELNVGGGIYSCPCHGSEFSNTGQLLQGPAERNLKTYKTITDNENIYIYLS